MFQGRHVSCVIPAFNESQSVGLVVRDFLAVPGDEGPALDEVIVCDNNSTDGTADVARAAGARVVSETRQGYGSACLKAIASLSEGCEIVLFADADRSDDPAETPLLLEAITQGGADLVIGSRVLGRAERGALTPQQEFGNRLAAFLIRLFWKHETTDLGPFRAITRQALAEIGMRDPDYGWTVEMQVKAIQAGLRVVEVPATYRRRIGQSKISGTLKGTVLAGYKILGTIGVLALRGRP